jgi:hypothetical protein
VTAHVHRYRRFLRGASATLLLGVGLTVASSALAAPRGQSPDGVWQSADASGSPSIQLGDAPASFFRLNAGALAPIVAEAPLQQAGARIPEAVTMTLPMPDGSFATFYIEESPVMEEGLAVRYPDFRTYRARGVEDPTMAARFSHTPYGFHAMIRRGDGTVLVQPTAPGILEDYVSYEPSALEAARFECFVTDMEAYLGPVVPTAVPSGDNMTTFRLAVAATGEYTDFFGSAAAALAGITSTVNMVNLVYNLEVAVHFNLIANTDDVIFTDAGSDPFPLSDKNAELQAELDATIGDANYDIGHLFHLEGSDISGNAGCIGCVCTSGSKGSAWSQGPDPTNSDYLFVVCHEMGHQVGGRHTFNGSSCSASNYSASSAYEPGSGTTIMSYSSVCGSDNVQGGLAGDLYFHANSRANIRAIVGAAACGSVAATGNGIPTVDAGASYQVPRGTPFILTASGSDPDGDPVTYCWEQYDLAMGGSAPLNTVDNGNIPLFRSFPPVSDDSRTFPRYSDLLAGNLFPGTLGEQLPGVDRTLTFRVTIRDNQPNGGGADDDETTIDVVGAPFDLTYPDGGESLVGGCPITVTWDVGGGDVAATVDIVYSTDGGLTFPTTLASGVTNDGSHDVTIPCDGTTDARIRINSVGNIFFTLSEGDFTVTEEGPVVTASITGGDVDDDCEVLVTFSGTVTDDCSVDDDDVDVTISLPFGGATLGTPTIELTQVDAATVEVSGSVLVSNLTGGPATVRIEIDAEDGCGNTGSDSADDTVQDTTPPTISVELNRYALWPPNHKMSEITATVVAEDNCDPNVAYVLTSITSNEPDNGLGDGDTANDIQEADYGTADLSFLLRAERAGPLPGRKYTIIYTAEDNAGNTATDTVCVRVPHDKTGLNTNAIVETPVVTPLKERFGLVFHGSLTRDVTLIDRNEAYLGNHVGALRPTQSRLRDADGDGFQDLVLFYDREATLDLMQESTVLYPVGFHVTAGDDDFWYESIRELGMAISDFEFEDGADAGTDIPRPEDASAIEPGDGDLSGIRGDVLTLTTAGPVRIEVFNVQGRRVRVLADRFLDAGEFDIRWDGRDDRGVSVATGVYFYRVTAPGVESVRKVHIVR